MARPSDEVDSASAETRLKYKGVVTMWRKHGQDTGKYDFFARFVTDSTRADFVNLRAMLGRLVNGILRAAPRELDYILRNEASLDPKLKDFLS